MDVSRIKEDYIIKNLHREAKIMAQLRHPCIVSLFQTMQNGKIYYLVTELIGGGDLCSFIKSQKYGKLDERNTRVYARQLISALAHMHNLGIVHRDLKMENVMINSIRTQVKIVDFGLSNSYDPNTLLRTHCGSPEYAAPELFVPGKSYGPEVDLWSLGVILFGMVAGQLPFVVAHEDNVSSQERRKKLLIQINKGYSIVQRKMLALVTPEFRSLIARMLVADALKRISIFELLQHDWVTDKGRKAIVINPIAILSDELHISVMKQVANVQQLDWRTVQYAINSEPYGDIAATYNILLHKLYSHRLQGDGITKTYMPQTYNFGTGSQITTNVKDPDKANTKKRIERVKSPSVHKVQKISATNTPGNSQTKQVTAFDNRPQTTIGGYRLRKTRDSSPLGQRPMLTADARNRMEIEADLKYNMRQLYSKMPKFTPKDTSKNTLHSSNLQLRQPQRLSLKSASNKIPVLLRPSTPLNYGNLKNEVHVVGSKGIANVLSKKKFLSLDNSRDSINTSHGESATFDRTRNKSGVLTASKRSVSSSTPVKGNRVITVMGTSSDPKPISHSSDRKSPQIRSRRVLTSKPSPKVDSSMFEEGQKAKPRPYSTTTSKQTITQRNILSDPIARSIAGYITKNMAHTCNSGVIPQVIL